MRKKFFAFIAMCLLVAGSAFGQSRTVTGQVISGSDDEPLIGVAICIAVTVITSHAKRGVSICFYSHYAMGTVKVQGKLPSVRSAEAVRFSVW